MDPFDVWILMYHLKGVAYLCWGAGLALLALWAWGRAWRKADGG